MFVLHVLINVVLVDITCAYPVHMSELGYTAIGEAIRNWLATGPTWSRDEKKSESSAGVGSSKSRGNYTVIVKQHLMAPFTNHFCKN